MQKHYGKFIFHNMINQEETDRNNASFWDELCGSSLAKTLGITDSSPHNLKKFDDFYFAYYPYLTSYVSRMGEIKQKKILEIGLGYGTLSQYLAAQNCDYYGLDISPGPVHMVKDRLLGLGVSTLDQVMVGSALDIPHPDCFFDYVYTIGCLHHTGNLQKAISEVYRVLKPSGYAIVMLYNKNSFRQVFQVRLLKWWQGSKNREAFDTHVRGMYDTNAAGEAAPHTDYVSQKEVRFIFSEFLDIKIEPQNFDSYPLPLGIGTIDRKYLLRNIAKYIGLDLYIVARK